MKPKERVLRSFSHKTPDRVPLDYVAVPEVNNLLMERLALPDLEALLRRLQIDFRHLDKWGTMVPEYVGPDFLRHADGTTEDIWGCRVKTVEYRPGCFYEEWVNPPLAKAASVREIEKHRWPDPDWYDFSRVADFCRRHDEYCLVGGRGATLDMVGFFRGMEQAMFDLYDNPILAEAITDKIFEFQYEYNRRLLAAAGGQLNILFFSEDMGGQNSLVVSRKMLQKYVFPKLKKYAELAHRNNALAMLHSDGAVREIIPELIDLGIDIINPVQPECPGMEPAGLKKDFGDKICFHGVLDSQKLLPFGTPREVAEEIKRLAEVMGVNGGFAISPNCGFQVDVPVENILKVYGTVTGE